VKENTGVQEDDDERRNSVKDLEKTSVRKRGPAGKRARPGGSGDLYYQGGETGGVIERFKKKKMPLSPPEKKGEEW